MEGGGGDRFFIENPRTGGGVSGRRGARGREDVWGIWGGAIYIYIYILFFGGGGAETSTKLLFFVFSLLMQKCLRVSDRFAIHNAEETLNFIVGCPCLFPKTGRLEGQGCAYCNFLMFQVLPCFFLALLTAPPLTQPVKRTQKESHERVRD